MKCNIYMRKWKSLSFSSLSLSLSLSLDWILHINFVRFPKNIGLFCKRAHQKRPIFCKRDPYLIRNLLISRAYWILHINFVGNITYRCGNKISCIDMEMKNCTWMWKWKYVFSSSLLLSHFPSSDSLIQIWGSYDQ